MNPKIKKIDAEYEKNAAKITELQARQKELSKERTELENLDIIGIVRRTRAGEYSGGKGGRQRCGS